MIEIPESATLSSQAEIILVGKKITQVIPAASPHKFAFYQGDPAGYPELLTGRQVQSAAGHGMFVDIHLDGDVCLTFGEGTILRYFAPYEKKPEKHQLLAVFDDGSFIVCSVAMYGAIFAFSGELDNSYYQLSLHCTSPLDDRFDEAFFENIFRGVTKDLSLKALLATEQRIPGLGNGVLQDILFNAGLHPKRKMSSLSDFHKDELFHSLKVTLRRMAEKGGRDTEKDLFGNYGGYKTLLSKNTLQNPCPNCGHAIVKEAYMGGAVYFCPSCQGMK
ncbi:MAG TPA: endonuclease VIII [Bacteroides sp.]|nr:endonuclease VIII [Bacteroides sp.]